MDDMNLPNGYILQKGKYKIAQVIGQGGFGITYKGFWTTEVKGSLGAMRTEIPVCIKEYFFKDYCSRDPQSLIVRVHSDTGKLLFNKFKEKLIKEAKILSEVHHPYIVNVLEVFEENNTAYIVMEYIAGSSLKDKLSKEGVLPEPLVLRYIKQIGEALAFVHQKNILHLDIKPSNIIIDRNNNARLIDFGVSKRYDIQEEETSTTMLTLSKGFAAIEQYDSEGIQTFTPCPDIYSLGATMYNLLTGKIPTESILRATRPLEKPSALNPHISPKVEEVILKAMEIVPTDRYQSVREMLDALDLSDEDLSSHPLDPSPQDTTNEEETTLLPSEPKVVSDKEEEETVLNYKGEEENSKQKETSDIKPKKRKAGVAAITIGVIILFGGSAAGWYVYTKNEPHLPQADVNVVKEISEIEKVDSMAMANLQPSGNELEKDSMPKTENITINPNEYNDNRTEIQAKKEEKPVIKEEEPKTTPAAQPPHEAEAEKTTPEVDKAALYKQWLASGKEKIEQNDFQAAKKDLNKAKEFEVTEEVIRLLVFCDQKIEEEAVVERKNGYEEKMPFGSYVIVRKKTNNRYGAIDEEGIERIPCKYLSVGRAENGRAFEREDKLFDIYASDGTLITQGATGY